MADENVEVTALLAILAVVPGEVAAYLRLNYIYMTVSARVAVAGAFKKEIAGAR